MKPPEAHQYDRDNEQDGDGRITTDNCHISPVAGRRLTAGRQRQPCSAAGVEQGDGRGASRARGQRSSSLFTQTDNAVDTANGDAGGQRQPRHIVDENGLENRVSSDVMMTDKALETSLSNEGALQSTRASHCGRNVDTTTTTSTTTAAAGTTTTDDFDVLSVESTLPEMNWDRLEEQLRNALQLERRAEVRMRPSLV